MSNTEKIKFMVYVNFTLLMIAVIYVIYSSALLQHSLPSPTDPRYPDEHRRIKHKIVVNSITWTFGVFLTVFLNVMLLRGVNQRSYKKCLIWFVYNCITTTGQIYQVVMSLVASNILEGTYWIIWAFISFYALYIVKSFMTEISSDSSLQPLTNKE